MPDAASSDAAGQEFSPAEQAAWFAQLPTMFAAAAALFTGSDGRVLLVKPNYRDHWSLPGGWPPRCAPGTPGRPPTCRGPSRKPDPQLARDAAGPDLTWS